MSIQTSTIGKTPQGRPIQQFRVTNQDGASMAVMTFGATLTSVKIPDKDGNIGEVTLGFDHLQGYLDHRTFFGSTIGRFGNRIAHGQFTLDGKTYSLAANDGPHHLHGGNKGFDAVIWEASPAAHENGVTLAYDSADGEEGYPGKLSVRVTYTFTERNDVIISYEAGTDRPTPVNLTNHAFWNLADAGRSHILAHKLRLYADRYLPVRDTLIPTGEIAPVRGTPMDFTSSHAIGERIAQVAGGYDHCWVLNPHAEKPAPAASVYDPKSGRIMEIYTTEPGIQFYSGNFLDGVLGRGRTPYLRHHGFCLETQHFPDAVNQPSFPPVVLRPGETYTQTTIHRFRTYRGND